MEGYRCYAGTTPRRRRTHVCTNEKDKLRPFATNSVFCKGFEPWTICYFLQLPTTQQHVNSCSMVDVLTMIPLLFAVVLSCAARTPVFTLGEYWHLGLGGWVFARFYFLCNNGVEHNIMVRRNIWYVCSLHISWHRIKYWTAVKNQCTFVGPLSTIFHKAKYLAQRQYCWTYYLMMHHFFSSSRVSETSTINFFAQLPEIITLFVTNLWNINCKKTIALKIDALKISQI
jgi:hypothetical protein